MELFLSRCVVFSYHSSRFYYQRNGFLFSCDVVIFNFQFVPQTGENSWLFTKPAPNLNETNPFQHTATFQITLDRECFVKEHWMRSEEKLKFQWRGTFSFRPIQTFEVQIMKVKICRHPMNPLKWLHSQTIQVQNSVMLY